VPKVFQEADWVLPSSMVSLVEQAGFLSYDTFRNVPISFQNTARNQGTSSDTRKSSHKSCIVGLRRNIARTKSTPQKTSARHGISSSQLKLQVGTPQEGEEGCQGCVALPCPALLLVLCSGLHFDKASRMLREKCAHQHPNEHVDWPSFFCFCLLKATSSSQ
jgi:hypothetical protein